MVLGVHCSDATAAGATQGRKSWFGGGGGGGESAGQGRGVCGAAAVVHPGSRAVTVDGMLGELGSAAGVLTAWRVVRPQPRPLR